MPRSARLVIPGLPYHITARGNNRTDIFCSDGDRTTYLDLLKEYACGAGVEILGYCLMTNHIHLVGIPAKEDSLARGIGVVQLRYAQLFNWGHGRCGHLWQGRFFGCPLDDAHLVAAMCYLERNPVRAGMVKRAEEYLWSSARAHLGNKEQTGLLSLELWERHWPPAEWLKMLRRPQEEAELQALRLQTRTGRPLGSDSFIDRLETNLGISLRPHRAGRRKKEQSAQR